MTVSMTIQGVKLTSKSFKFKENSSLLLRMGDTVRREGGREGGRRGGREGGEGGREGIYDVPWCML